MGSGSQLEPSASPALPRARLNGAIAAAFAARDPGRSSAADFAVPRPDGALSYLVSVRPLLDHNGNACSVPCAVMFVRDPLAYRGVDIGTLREVFALTEAEACLAKALQAGQSPADYAREHAVSLNTVYTHLRHLKDKTGCARMTALIRKLNELQVPLRLSSAGTVVWTPNAPLTGARISPILVTPGLGAA